MKKTKLEKQVELARKKARMDILNKLFRGELKREEVWNSFAAAIAGKNSEHLSIKLLESLADSKLGLMQRIDGDFPTEANKLYVMSCCDMELWNKITQRVWALSGSRRLYLQDAIFLHGDTWEEKLSDGAAQAVIMMLLEFIGVNIESEDDKQRTGD